MQPKGEIQAIVEASESDIKIVHFFVRISYLNWTVGVLSLGKDGIQTRDKVRSKADDAYESCAATE